MELLECSKSILECHDDFDIEYKMPPDIYLFVESILFRWPYFYGNSSITRLYKYLPDGIKEKITVTEIKRK